MTDFHLLITRWYRQNKRDLPWRNTKNPYFIWLSEIILQQTRVAQGIDYYLKFIKNYPTIHDLSSAKEQEILNDWQGLGYYSRARNLHAAAKQIVEDFEGIFPESHGKIKALKGVGDYTSAAIASFAFNLPYPVVDGNVFRLLSRYFADDTPIDSPAGKKRFTAYANELKHDDEIADFNQAMMEMGAVVCTPKKPNCMFCPLSTSCKANALQTQLNFPVKKKKTKVTKRYLNYLVLNENTYMIRKRTGKGIWQNMFEFPCVETKTESSFEEVSRLAKEVFDFSVQKETISKDKHILSHQTLHVTFWLVSGKAKDEDLIKTDTLENYPIPRVIDRFLENNPNYVKKK